MRVAKNGAPQLYAVGLSLGTFFGALTYRRLAGWLVSLRAGQRPRHVTRNKIAIFRPL